jgi:hypothetical protein
VDAVPPEEAVVAVEVAVTGAGVATEVKEPDMGATDKATGITELGMMAITEGVTGITVTITPNTAAAVMTVTAPVTTRTTVQEQQQQVGEVGVVARVGGEELQGSVGRREERPGVNPGTCPTETD